MVQRAMAQRTESDEGVREVWHPNREKAVVKATRLLVIVLLLVTIGLLLLITLGGWSELVGLRPVQAFFILIFAVLVFFALRWSRGMLPMASAFALLLAIFAAVGAAGWFERSKSFYASPLLPGTLVGLLVVLLIPVEVLLIVVAMRGFSQGWNVEEQRRPREGRDYGDAEAQPA
jgi:hypothetical protein